MTLKDAILTLICSTNLATYEEFVAGARLESTVQSSSATVSTKQQAVKLPKLIIERFDGDVKKWQSFIDSFTATVDSKPLTKVESFNYLKSYLMGDAARVIEGLSLTNDNNDKAMLLLKERFGNKQSITNAHMKELLKLQKVNDENDVAGIKIFYNEIKDLVGDNFGAILIPAVLDRLPNEFNKHLNRAKENGFHWNITKLLEVMKKE